MGNARPVMSGPGRNSHMTVSFTNDSQSTWRDWFFPLYPKGAKSVTTSIQTASGWAKLAPDPNRGFFAEHNTSLGNTQGAWLRGPMPPSACRNDVRLALTLLGHKAWEVSTWRIWIYRALASVLLGVLAYGIFSPAVLLAMALPFAIRSPCTPKGLRMWVEKKGFAPPALRQDQHQEDSNEKLMERMRAHATGQV